jgi:hypothetical protein
MKNILPLPDHLIQLVYLYDPTFKEVFDVVLHEMMLHARQEEEYTEFIIDQELERNHFTLCAGFYIDNLLNGD